MSELVRKYRTILIGAAIGVVLILVAVLVRLFLPGVQVFTLNIDSVPSGARVRVNGVSSGQTPLHNFYLELDEGTQLKVEAELDGYEVQTRLWTSVELEKKLSQEHGILVWDAAFPAATSDVPGSPTPAPAQVPETWWQLTVVTEPAGALVYVDEQLLEQKTPLRAFRLKVPDVNKGLDVRLELPGKPGKSRHFGLSDTLASSTGTERQLTWNARWHTAPTHESTPIPVTPVVKPVATPNPVKSVRYILNIESIPSGARVILNGMETGKVTPLKAYSYIQEDPSSQVVLTLSKAGYIETEYGIPVPADVLKRKSPVEVKYSTRLRPEASAIQTNSSEDSSIGVQVNKNELEVCFASAGSSECLRLLGERKNSNEELEKVREANKKAAAKSSTAFDIVAKAFELQLNQSNTPDVLLARAIFLQTYGKTYSTYLQCALDAQKALSMNNAGSDCNGWRARYYEAACIIQAKSRMPKSSDGIVLHNPEDILDDLQFELEAERLDSFSGQKRICYDDVKKKSSALLDQLKQKK